MSTAFYLDLDGDLDLLPHTSGISNREHCFENVDGEFIKRDPIQLEFDFGVVFGDIDGDGDQDFVNDNRSLTWHERRELGDSNGDGIFNSKDLVLAMQAAKYEDEPEQCEETLEFTL